MILEKNKEALQMIGQEYRNKYEELQKNHIRLINDMKRDGEKFDVALEQCEQEYEREILDKNVDYTLKLKNIEMKYEKKKNKFKELERE